MKTRQDKLLRLVKIETLFPGLLDKPTLCGEDWLLKHALDISQKDFESQSLTVVTPNGTVTLSLGMKRKELRGILGNIKGE